MRKNIVLSMLLGLELLAQEPKMDFSLFLDTYYVYDFSEPKNGYRQDFLFNHNRHNEININLALARINIEHEMFRSRIALQKGNYADDNYPKKYKDIHEANVGVSLGSEKLWLDVGMFYSHLGFESAISMDNYTLTRSLAAENSPYYLTGAKLTYTPNNEAEFAFIVCNGWQRIEKIQGNSQLSFGTQFIYKPNITTKFNWSTFVGTDEPDTTRKMIYFNDFFIEQTINKKLSVIAGVDVGLRQKNKHSSDYDLWHISTFIARYMINDKLSTAFRVEYANDDKSVIIQRKDIGFVANGVSANIDYALFKNSLLRSEVRYFNTKENVLNENKSNNVALTTSFAIKF